MKISKSTIIRTILVVLVIVNIFLEKCNIDVIPADEYFITMLVETLLEIAILIVGFWKNNSFSQAAIKADEFLKKLKGEGFETAIQEGFEEYESEVE